MVVYASLFGVGAPEVVLIGVVALLVFGPTGLAEVARSLGKTLRIFQPTIRKLQDVSNKFKSTIEREIGLDEIQSSLKYPYTPPANKKPETAVDSNDTQTTPKQVKLPPVSMENLLKNSEEQLTSSSPSASTASQEVPATPSTKEASANQEATAETVQSTPNKNTPIS